MKLNSIAALALSMVVCGTVTGDAEASTPVYGCTVTSVFYDTGRLMVNCSNNNYYGLGSTNYGSTCYPVSTDTIKIWESMAQAALLSGRRLDLVYDLTPGTCYSPNLKAIRSINLLKD